MERKLIMATGNPGKVREISALLCLPDLTVQTMREAGVSGEAVEDGTTFAENAWKKAAYVAERTGLPTVADDSGLEVDALGGAPGVYSARYAGVDATDAQRIEKLLSELEGATDRTARFVCCVCLLLPDGRRCDLRGECAGVILEAPRGADGFGYDPVFYLPEFEKTFAEMDAAAKNRVSHRAKAFGQLQSLLELHPDWLA